MSESESTEAQAMLRLVAYGPAGSGKTATVSALADGMGQAMISFAADAGDTSYFDWMDYEGGRHRGQPISVHLVGASSSGGGGYRKALLRTADAVLFVADTTEAGIDATIESYLEAITTLEELGDRRPSIVVQANKRDLDGLVSIDDLRDRLALEDDQTVIETVAVEGQGTRQAFVYAVRMGLQHLSALEESGAELLEHEATPVELLAWLTSEGHLDEAAASPEAAESVEPAADALEAVDGLEVHEQADEVEVAVDEPESVDDDVDPGQDETDVRAEADAPAEGVSLEGVSDEADERVHRPVRNDEYLPEEMNGEGFYAVDRPEWQEVDEHGRPKAGRRKDDPSTTEPPPPGPDSTRYDGPPPDETADTVISKFVSMLRGE